MAVALPRFHRQLEQMLRAERRDGWLCACQQEGRFLVLSQELVAALGDLLGRLRPGPILEVCAGKGELAEALGRAGLPVVATDAHPPQGSRVKRASAGQALRQYRPGVVLGCFVPVDAGVDQAVMGFPSVRHYVVLGARVGGLFGSPALWRSEGWTAQPLEQVSRYMLTRHDLWLPGCQPAVLRHGEAWYFRRIHTDEPR